MQKTSRVLDYEKVRVAGKAPQHEAIQTSAALPGSIGPTGCSSGVFGEAYQEIFVRRGTGQGQPTVEPTESPAANARCLV
jgi:hypothetical protein